ncbi:hypothetical protein BCR37DRAFT_348451 [Protomyces lactucae-debilis]|uniref:Ketoreductase domain-containing protein n=1 Tax=Protomyces lactucae-debilis TaxID=2754530 RepID=A0A1Y2FAK8_PROLT|nr:uncharacterized protein BCR37DRAFT_348451 [Protomyces lactucae-debilis]ORY80949.1 hypothetical protein BCR37DRAFT_348451 [Protomyces lactucae-debilis]
MSNIRLAGKVALITGGSRGIGLAIAKTFAQHGSSCTLIGRKEGSLREAIKQLASSEAQKHDILAFDVGHGHAWDSVDKSGNQVDLLVNAAGITHYSLLPRTPQHVMDEIVQVNLLGTIYGCKAISRKMLSNKQGGCIINISSALAHRGGAGSSVYAATKAGLLGFSRALAEELGPRGIRCNAIAPGYIETDILADSLKSQAAGKSSIGRIGTAAEVADAALFLATNQFANGMTLTLDGGLSYA